MSTQIDLGPVLSVPKGDWNAATTYERLNIVRYNSSSWICNVATSKGVEPTEDSTDWYLQVKDTSSVTSVNGMKGDVVIELTETETPPADDNSNRIATTEWVTDKLGDVDLSGIKEDTVLAAQNAGSLEVGTGELTSAELAAIIDNNDSALRAFIEEEYLPLSGGTVTGDILFSATHAALSKNDNTGRLVLRGGAEGTSSGGSVMVYGKDNPDYPGISQFVASDGTNTHYIRVTPDGSFVCDAQHIVRSVNGFNADGLGDVQINAMSMGNVSANTLTTQGVYYVSGDSTALPSGTNGYIVVDSVDGLGFVRQIFYRAGTVDANDHNIYTRQKGSNGTWGTWVKMLTSKDNGAVESQSVGSSGYVRLVGGLQICWGNVVNAQYTTFPKAFSANPAIAATHSMSSTSGDSCSTGVLISTTRVYYRDQNGGSNGGRYIAFGSWA